jgi:hypothetical protein
LYVPGSAGTSIQIIPHGKEMIKRICCDTMKRVKDLSRNQKVHISLQGKGEM